MTEYLLIDISYRKYFINSTKINLRSPRHMHLIQLIQVSLPEFYHLDEDNKNILMMSFLQNIFSICSQRCLLDTSIKLPDHLLDLHLLSLSLIIFCCVCHLRSCGLQILILKNIETWPELTIPN